MHIQAGREAQHDRHCKGDVTGSAVDAGAVADCPLGLDVWEVRPDHVVLQATEAQIERLEQMGYGVEQLHMTDTYLSTFATAEATAGYHSAEQLEQDLRALAE